jgi:hypothetical protein
MSKNAEFATALAYLKNKTKTELSNTLAAAAKNEGIELTADGWRRLQTALENSVENSVNASHNAFRTLLA